MTGFLVAAGECRWDEVLALAMRPLPTQVFWAQGNFQRLRAAAVFLAVSLQASSSSDGAVSGTLRVCGEGQEMLLFRTWESIRFIPSEGIAKDEADFGRLWQTQRCMIVSPTQSDSGFFAARQPACLSAQNPPHGRTGS